MKKELFDYLKESLEEALDHAEGKTFLPTTVYKRDSKGQKRSWKISVIKYDTWSSIEIESGLVEGKKFTQNIPIHKGKNLGKANETTHYTQAVAEATAKVEQQVRDGYVGNLNDVKESGTLGSGIKNPMLAHKYDPEGKQSSSRTLEKMGILGKTVYVQPKLDGQRCLIKLTPTDDNQSVDAVMYTRKGDVRKIQLDHILDEIKHNYVDIFVGDGGLDEPETIILDGELFSNELEFNEANGLLNKKKFTPKEAEKAKKLKFHLYDILIDEVYPKRYEKLKPFTSDRVEIIPNYEIIATDENIKEKLDKFLEAENEGLMIRLLNKGYENKRTWQLVKCKLYEDAEFRIVGLEKNVQGRLGKFIVELPEPTKDRDGKVITTFKAGLGKGISHADGLKILANEKYYIGKMATIEFFGRSEYNVPRHPKFKAIREDI
jgi:ATP-dependent DNA ligase